MLLLQNYLDDFGKKADTENIRIKVLGDTTILSTGMQKSIENSMERTKNNMGTTLCLAFNYGGREEILNATKRIAQEVKDGKLKLEDISEQTISNHLYTAGIPEPDLVIRTSNELRTSNFLPWQIVYSEFYFLEKNWPDFTENDLDLAIEEYHRRNRKFGGT